MKLLARFSTFSIVALLAVPIHANTEKVIFLAPPSQRVPNWITNSDRLGIRTLSPTNSSIRTALSVSFSKDSDSYAVEYWYLLRDLKPGQRNEVRVCWVATQPTDFRLTTFSLEQLLENPPSAFVPLFESEVLWDTTRKRPPSVDESILGLRIQAKADFFTTNQTLMRHPPPIDVDIILDPYIANVFPASLLPTAAYILVLAVIGWYVSEFVWSWLVSIAASGKLHED